MSARRMMYDARSVWLYPVLSVAFVNVTLSDFVEIERRVVSFIQACQPADGGWGRGYFLSFSPSPFQVKRPFFQTPGCLSDYNLLSFDQPMHSIHVAGNAARERLHIYDNNICHNKVVVIENSLSKVGEHVAVVVRVPHWVTVVLTNQYMFWSLTRVNWCRKKEPTQKCKNISLWQESNSDLTDDRPARTPLSH